MLKEGNKSFSTQVVAPYSEAFSDNLARVSIHGKSKNIYIYGGNYFAGVDLEGKKAGATLGRSSEGADPLNGHQVLSEKPDQPEKHRLDQSLQCLSPNCRRPAARLGTQAPYTHNRRYLQTQQDLAPGQGFQGQASSVSREQLTCPDEKPGRPGLQSHRPASGCLCVFTTKSPATDRGATCRAIQAAREDFSS